MVVLEARHLGYGGTGRNGGGDGRYRPRYRSGKKHVGKEGLETLFKIANLGAGIIRERIRKYNIDADFVPGYGYLAYNQRQLKTLRQWEKEFKAATRMKRSNCIPEKRCSRWWAPRSTAAR